VAAIINHMVHQVWVCQLGSKWAPHGWRCSSGTNHLLQISSMSGCQVGNGHQDKLICLCRHMRKLACLQTLVRVLNARSIVLGKTALI
jgi:hypothetical protein